MAKYQDVKDVKFKVGKLGEDDVLFIDERIDSNSVPKELFVYQCRHADHTTTYKPVTVEEHVLVNFAGTIIAKKEHKFTHGDANRPYTPLTGKYSTVKLKFASRKRAIGISSLLE